jgi:hypothetical protein
VGREAGLLEQVVVRRWIPAVVAGEADPDVGTGGHPGEGVLEPAERSGQGTGADQQHGQLAGSEPGNDVTTAQRLPERFTFGDAKFHGSMGAAKVNAPVRSMVPTPDGAGYWLVAGDGGIFNFSDGPFAGSLGADPPQHPITAVATIS